MVNDNDHRWLDAEYDRLTRAAQAVCDERFPNRFRRATATDPAVTDWIAEFHDLGTQAAGLLITGPVGTGKTHQAYGAVRSAVTVPVLSRVGHPYTHKWMATTYAAYCAAMRPRPGTDTEAGYQKIAGTSLLFIDDLGIAKSSEFTEEITYRLINDRYEACLPTIFTTNHDGEGILDALGDRIHSRLTQMCRVVSIAGTDRRWDSGPQTGLEATGGHEHAVSGTRGWEQFPNAVRGDFRARRIAEAREVLECRREQGRKNDDG